MTLTDLPLAGPVAHALGRGARATIRRAGCVAAAAAMVVIGCGFVLFAAFSALRVLVGPGFAALGLGIALLALAALLIRLGPGRVAKTPPAPAPTPVRPTPTADATTLAVFTAAFVLGRRLADRRRG